MVVLFLTPQIGFEPMTNRLTADRSTTELSGIAIDYSKTKFPKDQALGEKRLEVKLTSATIL